MLKQDYTKLYLLQDKFFGLWKTLEMPFYLTGGTALSRFWLHHRYSDDLDFFVNNDTDFNKNVQKIFLEIKKNFNTERFDNVIYDTFARFFIEDQNVVLKLDFVNDTPYRAGKAIQKESLIIDTPHNILSNKLSAIINREEPKDIFDIIHISLNYNFNWLEIFEDVKQKALVNEIDIEQKIHSFPVELLRNMTWISEPIDENRFSDYIKIIANDFITGSDNTICKTNTSIYNAQIIEN